MSSAPKKLLALAFLLATLALTAMDDTISLHRPVIECIKTEYLSYFRLFDGKDHEAVKHLASYRFEEPSEYISFAQLMDLLGNCIALSTQEDAKNQIIEHISKNQFSFIQLAEFYNKIDFFELELLRRPLEIVILQRLIEKHNEGNAQYVKEMFELLSSKLVLQLKELLLSNYTVDTWAGLGKRLSPIIVNRDIPIPSIYTPRPGFYPQISKNNKYNVSIFNDFGTMALYVFDEDGKEIQHIKHKKPTLGKVRLKVNDTHVAILEGQEIYIYTIGSQEPTKIDIDSIRNIIGDNSPSKIIFMCLNENFMAVTTNTHVVLFELQNLNHHCGIIQHGNKLMRNLSANKSEWDLRGDSIIDQVYLCQSKLIRFNGGDGIYVYDIASGKEIKKEFNAPTYLNGIAFSNDDKYVAIHRSVSTDKYSLEAYCLEDLRLVNEMSSADNMSEMVYLPGERYKLIQETLRRENAVAKRHVKLWDHNTNSNDDIANVYIRGRQYFDVDYMLGYVSDQNYAISATNIYDGSSRIILPLQGTVPWKCKGHGGVAISTDKKIIFWNSHNGYSALFKIWPCIEEHSLLELLSQIYPNQNDYSTSDARSGYCTIS